MSFNSPFTGYLSRNGHTGDRDALVQDAKGSTQLFSNSPPRSHYRINTKTRQLNEIDIPVHINHQTVCPLYSKLPTEIREHIFKYIISGSGNVVHIFRRYPKMSYWRCTGQHDGGPCTWENPCSKTLPQYGQRIDHEKNKVEKFNTNWGVVALMRTCEKLYRDISPRLYRDTHFHFPTFRDLAIFTSELRVRDRNSLRYLSIDWDMMPLYYAYDRKQSMYSWAAIRRMVGLEELKMVQKDGQLDLRGDSAHCWKNGLHVLQRLKVLEFVVPVEDVGKWKEFLGKTSNVVIKGHNYMPVGGSAA